MSSVALCVVAGGDIYRDYADRLVESAQEFFKPSDDVIFRIIPGDEGWPDGTMRRYHHLLQNMPFADYVFLSDADMRFESEVGPEILSRLTVTSHPGYVGQVAENLPHERRPESSCYVPLEEREHYFCGGFVGGAWFDMFCLAAMIAKRIDRDAANGLVPTWHDESALNKLMTIHEPELILSPSYCYPDNDSWYQSFWPERYERKLVALDKTAAERVGR